MENKTKLSSVHCNVINLASCYTAPPVQDNLVARVLLEHVHPDPPPPPRDPHRAVNYLDLSRLGEEGETPASDEIWLAVEDGGDGCGGFSDLEDDNFLSTDDEDQQVISQTFTKSKGGCKQ